MKSLSIRLVMVILGMLLAPILARNLWLDHELTSVIHSEEVEHVKLQGNMLLSNLRILLLDSPVALTRQRLERMRNDAGVIDLEVLRPDGSEAYTDLSTVQAVNRYLGQSRFNRESVNGHRAIDHSPAFSKALHGQVAIDGASSGQMTLFLPIVNAKECAVCHGYDAASLRGVLRLVVSTAAAEQRIGTMHSRLRLTTGIVILLVICAVWFAVQWIVLTPIRSLCRAITLAGEGDRAIRLPETRWDELGEVAMLFNLMQEQLAADETCLRAVMDNVVDAVITVDHSGVIESANRAVSKVFCYEHQELLGKDLSILMPEPHRSQYRAHIADYMHGGHSDLLGIRREIEGLRKDGTAFPMELALSEMRLHGRRYFIAIAHNIAERKEHMAAIEYQALHDPLTDLPNRTLLSDRMHQAILGAVREKKIMALIVMDLDRFKEINDTLGHYNGDLILQQVAARICEVLRESDTVARLGGDEFAVLLPSANLQDATSIAKKLLTILNRPFDLAGQTFQVGASLGIALYPEHGRNATILMNHADAAMYDAKRDKIGYAIYNPDKDPHSLRNLALMGELRTAIDQQQLILHYQPWVNVQTGRINGTEALIRWQHPRHGLIYPEDFMLLAEQVGLVKPVTMWMLKYVMAQNRIWQQSGINLNVAVSLSARNVQDNTFPEEMAALLQDYDKTEIAKLHFEITESAMLSDSRRTTEVLKALGDMGARIMVDDFGTGYSSLPSLKQLPVAKLKIDKSFVMGMAYDESDAVIVRSVIDLAHNIHLAVMAGGVEDQQTYDLLEALGCDEVQGSYIGQPMTAEEIMIWLQSPRWRLHASGGR